MSDLMRISVAFASDEVTAMPLGAAIAALIQTRAEGSMLDIHVLSCGITDASRARIFEVMKSAPDGTAELSWHAITGDYAKQLERFYINSERPYPPANYARLQAGDFLPKDRKRVIYMDIDTATRKDLRPLMEIPFEGDTAALVVRDLPHDAGQMDRLLSTLSQEDIARYGVTAEAHYFQAGIMVMNLEAFRSGVVDEIADLLQRYPQLTFPDQDALNVVLSGRHQFMDPRWNQMTAIYWYDDAAASPYDQETFDQLQADPFVVHYSGRPKPWEEGSDHPWLEHWQTAFAVTPWAADRQTVFTRIRDKALRARRVLRKKVMRRLG